MASDKQMRFAAFALVLLAIAARLVAIVVLRDNLSTDPDAYVGIAKQIASGQGFAAAETGEPTAYRPPLYPLLIVAVWPWGGQLSLGITQVILGGATVWLTWLIARKLGLGAWGLLACAAVALDPILVQYTSLPMTEVLCAFLVTWLLYRIVGASALGIPGSARNESLPANRTRIGRPLLTGVVFGLCALCRPTIWAYGALLAAWSLLCAVRERRLAGRWWLSGLMTLAGVVLVVAPWAIRNLMIFKSPIFMTTHGGYTLLLGNNQWYYRDVVSQSWNTAWEGDQLQFWQQSLEKRIGGMKSPVTGELARDRWMQKLALQSMSEDPERFIKACVMRLIALWRIVPEAPVARTLPRLVYFGIGIGYILLTIGLVIGLIALALGAVPDGLTAESAGEYSVRTIGRAGSAWAALVLLLIAFTSTHLVYWTNMRMRAPLVPAIAILSALGARQIAAKYQPRRKA